MPSIELDRTEAGHSEYGRAAEPRTDEPLGCNVESAGPTPDRNGAPAESGIAFIYEISESDTAGNPREATPLH